MASPTSATRSELASGLERLYASCDFEARLRTDPARFPRRYDDPLDQELAAVLAGSLAYGRVTLFGPVLTRLLDQLDGQGGPRAFVEGFSPADAELFADFRYRFNRPQDLVLLFGALRRLIERWGRLGAVAEHHHAGSSMAASLEGLVASFEEAAGGSSEGFAYWLARPSKGSACKRWCMVYRWMVRGPEEGVDLGLWALPRSALLIPVDTHVLRIGRLLGLTRAKTGSWRVAEEITKHLRELDPQDPVRFDFALAHLGISGHCRGGWHPEACPSCPLQSCCSAASSKR